MTDNNTNMHMTEKDLTKLANRIVSKMMHLKTMEQWFDHVRDSDMGEDQDFYALNISEEYEACLLYTSPSPRDGLLSRMPSSA